MARAKAQAREDELQEKHGHSTLAMVRARTKRFFLSRRFQFSVAAFILVAFLVDVLESSVLPPPGSAGAAFFFWADVAITAAFALELMINAFAHSDNGFRPFYTKRNNWFDASIVAVSIASVLMEVFNTGVSAGVIKMVRLVRVVRVARFFSHFQQLNRIVQAIGVSGFGFRV